MVKPSRFACCLVVFLTSLSVHVLAAPYAVVDVGALGTSPWITGINSLGQVVGVTGVSDPSQGAFVWSRGTGFAILPTLPGYSWGLPRSINNNGQIVGYADSSRACLWENGGPAVDLGALPSGELQPCSVAYGINNAGYVVGTSTSLLGYSHAFIWRGTGSLEDIAGSDDAAGSSAYAINDSGTVVGQRVRNAFTWTQATGMRDLGRYGQGSTKAIDVNNAGRVLLDSYSTGVYNEAFVWDEGVGARNLGVLPTDKTYIRTIPYDMNNAGQVVGASNWQPFIWDDAHGMQPLPMLQGHSEAYAQAINDLGMIAGYSIDASGNRHFVLWEPVPEPSSLLALIGGLGSLGAGLIRMRRQRA